MRTDIIPEEHMENAPEGSGGMPAAEGGRALRGERGTFHPAAWGFLDRIDAAEEAAGRGRSGTGF